MRTLFIFVFLLIATHSFGQILTQNANKMSPKEDYKNVKVIPIHSDDNTSVFMIFVKQAVRKHVHQYHTEVVTVLEGSGKMYLGGDYFEVKKGDHIVIPPNTAHAVITTSAKPLKVLSVQSPQFVGQDRIFIEEETPETTDEKTDKKDKNTKPKKKDNDIPEFEGEFD
ncbi:cupin domain-containing protein [Aureispira anguillae]|uniref:Cupin domain-containing protein n=1 Tax=Aureispira anguillae TaxID=2864201 RepID=A0A915YLW8_9BACT|nr:cupin domain-containing protein [Aureispira anguillae]BDS15346.1 cupin domain-containing protein [Aureispira anguillae]